jgi:hypothetical protein
MSCADATDTDEPLKTRVLLLLPHQLGQRLLLDICLLQLHLQHQMGTTIPFKLNSPGQLTPILARTFEK